VKALYQTLIDAPPRRVFAFHEEPDALSRLLPPGETARVEVPPRSLETGTRVVVRTRVGRFWVTIVAEHVAYEKDVLFVDEMREGPFRHWRHEHRFEPVAGGRTRLVDSIEYELPFGRLGALLGGWMVRRRLDRMFDHRHRITREACEREPSVG
jgi:ligand-binding SRPBCC domain-containing protein